MNPLAGIPRTAHQPLGTTANEYARARNGTADTGEETTGDVLTLMARHRGDARTMDGFQLRQARIDAGLTFDEACDIVGVSRLALDLIEHAHGPPPPGVAARMNDVYGLGGC